MEARPFPFEKLPKVSRQEVQLIASLQELFPRIGFSDELGRAIKILISREMGLPFSFRREKLEMINLTEKARSFSRQGVYLLFGLPPVEQKGLLELDPLLAHMAIDKLLGGTGELLTMVRPLTAIEEGVLSYLFLKLFALIFERCGKSARVHFRMEGFRSSPEEILPLFRGTDKVIYASFRLTFGERAGYARLILPPLMAQKTFLEPLESASSGAADEEAAQRDLAYYGARFSNLGYVTTPLWSELGRTNLKVKEINALEPGDVVILEKTQARVQGGLLAGHLPIRIGKGERGAFRGEILPDPSRLRVRLDALELEQPV